MDLGSFVPKTVSVGSEVTYMVSANGTLISLGLGSKGALGRPGVGSLGKNSGDMGDNLDRVNLGDGFNATILGGSWLGLCVIDGNKPDLTAMKCFGSNKRGHLGYGDKTN